MLSAIRIFHDQFKSLERSAYFPAAVTAFETILATIGAASAQGSEYSLSNADSNELPSATFFSKSKVFSIPPTDIKVYITMKPAV